MRKQKGKDSCCLKALFKACMQLLKSMFEIIYGVNLNPNRLDALPVQIGRCFTIRGCSELQIYKEVFSNLQLFPHIFSPHITGIMRRLKYTILMLYCCDIFIIFAFPCSVCSFLLTSFLGTLFLSNFKFVRVQWRVNEGTFCWQLRNIFSLFEVHSPWWSTKKGWVGVRGSLCLLSVMKWARSVLLNWETES